MNYFKKPSWTAQIGYEFAVKHVKSTDEFLKTWVMFNRSSELNLHVTDKELDLAKKVFEELTKK